MASVQVSVAQPERPRPLTTSCATRCPCRFRCGGFG